MSLEVKDISFSYRNGLVLHNVSLAIAAGEMVGLIGPNGSGKTTLLRLISGVLKPTSGEIRLDGSSLGELSRRATARSVAVVPQQFYTPFAFTAEEVVSLGRIPFVRALSGMSRDDERATAAALEMAGVGGLAQRRFDELSGGERQKVILAMALAQRPKLLLLDEPTVHLDISHQAEILNLVQRLNEEEGLTVIAALHDLNLASLYFRRLVLLKKGRVSADGTPGQVLTEARIRDAFSADVSIEVSQASETPHIVIVPRTNNSRNNRKS